MIGALCERLSGSPRQSGTQGYKEGDFARCNSGTPRLGQSDDVVRRPTCELPNGDSKGLGRQLTSSLARAAATEILLTMLRTDLSADKPPAFGPPG